jgi:hypothetical protein
MAIGTTTCRSASMSDISDLSHQSAIVSKIPSIFFYLTSLKDLFATNWDAMTLSCCEGLN